MNETYNPFKVQVGGNHYSKYPIQPMEYIEKNKLPFADGSVVKYITRWRDKGGIEDLRKAKHFIEMLIALEEEKNKGAVAVQQAQINQQAQQNYIVQPGGSLVDAVTGVIGAGVTKLWKQY